MKDLNNYKNPFDFEIRETCDVNTSFIRHIPYKQTFEEVSNDKFYEDAILEMIARCGNNHALAQFSDEGVPGASKYILNSIKNSINIIAAVLSKTNISHFYPCEDNDTYWNKFISLIHIEVVDSVNEIPGITFSVEYHNTRFDNPEIYLLPIVVQCNIPLIYDRNKIHHKDIIVPGDTTYTLFVGAEQHDPEKEPQEYIEDTNKLNYYIGLFFEDTVDLLYKLLNNEKNSRCSTCNKNKFDNVECLVGNLPIDVTISKLYEDYVFKKADNNQDYSLIICENDVGGFKRFSDIGRCMVEYSLMIEDYLNAPEKE